MRLTRCDVVVVGAGPAGSSTARFAALGGAKVIVVDRRARVGEPVQCAEHVSLPILRYLPRPREVIVQPIHAMRTHLGDASEVAVTTAPGAIIRRDVFDRQLAQEAERAGAEYLMGTSALGLREGRLRVRSAGVEREIEASVVIGADGPRSCVRRFCGGDQQHLITALQVRMQLCRPLATTEVWFEKFLVGGYGWVFPRGAQANVGIGVDPRLGPRAREVLDRFIAQLIRAGIVAGKPHCRTAGLLPVGGTSRLRQGRVLLVGDAAGQCHPLTGAGIANAVLCGEMAGHAAAEAALSGDLDALDEYVEDAEDLLAMSLGHAAGRRMQQNTIWTLPNPDWQAGVRRSWIAYNEYRIENEYDRHHR